MEDEIEKALLLKLSDKTLGKRERRSLELRLERYRDSLRGGEVTHDLTAEQFDDALRKVSLLVKEKKQ